MLLVAGSDALIHHGTVRTVAITLTTAMLVLLRRVLPATALLTTAIGSVSLGCLVPLLVVTAWSAGRRIVGVGRSVGAFALAYVLPFGLSVHQEPHLIPLVALLLLAAITMPGLAGRYWSQRRTLLDVLRKYDAQVLCEREIIAEQARMREQQYIVQNMHDSLGHRLALLSLYSGALETGRELTERQREAVDVLRGTSVAAMHELRKVMWLLRPDTPASGQAGIAHVGETLGDIDTKSSSSEVASAEDLEVRVSREAPTEPEEVKRFILNSGDFVNKRDR
ncbi:histidine kinase [Streptomyces sp. NPDC048595]|uniref:histidine kinase n=1 Tax=Streptomyces sp. NPDC048595 TaxID=3365576 RepID=UPI0037113E73